mgnify:CR=1 FL=1
MWTYDTNVIANWQTWGMFLIKISGAEKLGMSAHMELIWFYSIREADGIRGEVSGGSAVYQRLGEQVEDHHHE